MKEKEFTEQDSLELITQMIQQSKRNMKVGNGNILLCYGYPAVILSVVVYFLVHTTGNSVWAALWFLMFTPSFWIAFRRCPKSARSPTAIQCRGCSTGGRW